MKRELIKTLPYDEVNFKWVSNHWDVHLNGLCTYNGELCEFENDYPEYDEEKDEWKEMLVRIYKLDLMSKLAWKKRQWSFEKMVGYHWTYPQRKQGQSFYYRKPKWLYGILFKLFYWKW
jgi:hypothetical protein